MKGKVWAYILIVLGFLSIVASIVVIVGSIFIETKLIGVVNSVYQPIQNVYSDADERLTKAENNVGALKNDFDVVSSQLSNISGNISDQAQQTLTDGVNKVQGKATKVEDMLGTAKDAVNAVNDKIDVVNSLKVTTLPRLSGERVNEASVKVNDTKEALNTLKSDIQSDGTGSKPVITIINQSLDRVQSVLKEYHSGINDAQKKAKDLKDMIIIWSTLGTIFIVGFFLWTIYSFVSLIRNQFIKLKGMKHD